MIDVGAVKVGTKLKLADGIVAEVTENMEDGQWLQVRYLESPAAPPKSAPSSCATHRTSSRY